MLQCTTLHWVHCTVQFAPPCRMGGAVNWGGQGQCWRLCTTLHAPLGQGSQLGLGWAVLVTVHIPDHSLLVAMQMRAHPGDRFV